MSSQHFLSRKKRASPKEDPGSKAAAPRGRGAEPKRNGLRSSKCPPQELTLAQVVLRYRLNPALKIGSEVPSVRAGELLFTSGVPRGCVLLSSSGLTESSPWWTRLGRLPFPVHPKHSSSRWESLQVVSEGVGLLVLGCSPEWPYCLCGYL